ncbi:MAG: calcium/sodium antiporter [Acidaminobacter sp.]|uniref:calcium/sodium antiporter n=1 Tax=Acidaminobacter sp. TaxID=1872102 RepID=UPI001382495A|nr:calcium/sodium antiporter [Acidaminobacter sp.]MZQ98078.1 calcium/sodium antiporter [Acidaminobacter sp.]
MEYVLLLIGFLILVKGADFFVEGSSEIATFLRIPPLLIGLTIVAFGTSAPEAAVSISAALKGTGDIAVGNVVGSNLFNILFILGITAIIQPLVVERQTIKKEIPFALLGSIVLLVLIADRVLVNQNAVLSRGDGLILLTYFSVFIYYILEVAKNSREQFELDDIDPSPTNIGKYVLYTIGGLVAIVFGGDMVVKNAIVIAMALGMSETLVGLTIVAVGTSLPELITSVTAALKNKSEIAVGNIVGSNIFNIFFILGISSVIHPIVVDSNILIDAVIMIISTVILLIFSLTHSKITRGEGAAFMLMYLGYMAYILIRN